ncbi:hypothetical protein FoTM2_017198 [Fusarium oxysporum f. sp. vasinfectum]|nr:hypothetical protein FoTM2_017198 [Fusarium oxysporum f. sp. vasinfectum]
MGIDDTTAIRSITTFGSSASTRTISANGNFTIATIITASSNQVSDIIPPPFIISTIDFGAPLHAPIAQERPAAQVVMSPGPAVSNSEQPNNVRPTSQTSQVLAPPPSLTAQPKASSQALVNSSQPSERPRVTRPKASSKPSVDIVLLNRQAGSEAWSQPMTSGQQAATNSPTHMPAAHQRHSETPPPVSPAKSHGAPQAMLSQNQAPSAISQHPFIAENTPGAQPEGPAQILSRQPPARYAPRPTSPAPQNSPRLPPMVVPQPDSQLDGHYLPNTMLAQQQAALSMPGPGSAGHTGLQPMPSPSHAMAEAHRPGSASQGHIVSQAMPSPRQAAMFISRPGSALPGSVASQQHASPRQASNEVPHPSSAYSGHPGSQPMHSPHQAATRIQRSQSGFQGHPASQPMHSPRQVPGELPHPASAYQGHPNYRPVPPPRGVPMLFQCGRRDRLTILSVTFHIKTMRCRD